MKKLLISAVIAHSFLFNTPAFSSLRVPDGFEELAQGQIMWLDVSLYGESLGLYQAKVDLEKIVFLQPAKLIVAVKEKYSDSPDLEKTLTSSFKLPLKRNGNLSCGISDNAPGCGFIETDAVAVIYDENAARLDLFLAKQFLPEKKGEDRYYQASAESHNALVHQQNLNFVADKDYQSASLQGNGTLGVTQNGYLNLDWNWQGQRFRSAGMQKVEVNNVYFRQDFLKRVYVQGGIMDPRDIFSNAGGNINLSQLPIGKIQGLRAGSTLAWINQDKAIRGTPVNVFLSREARVDAYRDHQLLTSFYLNAGAQQLDTRSFPAGSYVVTLQIYEDNRLVRTETVPYTGSGNAPLNTFQWFLQGGKVADDDGVPDGDGNSVIQGGVRIPLTTALSVTAGAAALGNVNYFESAADWTYGFNAGPIDGVMTTRLSYLHGNDGSTGNIQQMSYNDGFSLSFYRSQMTAPDCNTQGKHRYSYSGCYSSTSMMLSVPVSQWNASLGYSMNNNQGRYVLRRELDTHDDSYGSGAPWEQVYATRSRSQTWQMGLSRSFSIHDLNLNTSINAFTRKDTGFNGVDKGAFVSVSLMFAGRNVGGGNRSSSSLGTSWQTSRRDGDRLTYNAAYSRYADNTGENELGASLYGVNSQTATASAYSRVGGQFGNGSITVSDSYDSTQGHHALSSSGSYSSSLVVDRSGLALGRWGDGTPSSAITLGVDAPEGDSESRVNVSLDSGGSADVQGNRRALFTVPGYRQATFSVNESSSIPGGIGSEISRGAGTRTVFMTPGKVYSRNVEVQSRYTWLGRMMDENNQPLEDGIPLNVSSWTPLGAGSFTLETSRPLKTLYVMKDRLFWQCHLQVRAVRDVVRWVGATRCQTTDLVRLPSAEQKQVKLMLPHWGDENISTAQVAE